VKSLEWGWWKKAKPEPLGRILKKDHLIKENFISVQWNRENMRKVLHCERAKNWPKIPQTQEEID